MPADAPVVMSRASLARYGVTPGAGVVLALDLASCPLASSARLVGPDRRPGSSARIVEYLAGQSTGQVLVNGRLG